MKISRELLNLFKYLVQFHFEVCGNIRMIEKDVFDLDLKELYMNLRKETNFPKSDTRLILKTRNDYLNIVRHQLKLKESSFDETKKMTSRKSCIPSSYSAVIFHTHSFVSYSYPSVEDIIKISGNFDYIRASIIATQWGIWILKNNKNSKLNASGKKFEQLSAFLKYHIDQMGLKIKGNRLTIDDRQVINESIKQVKYATFLDVDFFEWTLTNNGIDIDI
jgi:hypothetical protein